MTIMPIGGFLSSLITLGVLLTLMSFLMILIVSITTTLQRFPKFNSLFLGWMKPKKLSEEEETSLLGGATIFILVVFFLMYKTLVDLPIFLASFNIEAGTLGMIIGGIAGTIIYGIPAFMIGVIIAKLYNRL